MDINEERNEPHTTLSKTFSKEVIKISKRKNKNFSHALKEKTIFHKMARKPISENPELLKILQNSFDNVSPLIYLNLYQRELLINKMTYVHYSHKNKLYSPEDGEGPSPAFLLLKGAVQIHNETHAFEDFMPNVGFFGYGGPIFNSRGNVAVVDDDTYVGVIEPQIFLELIVPFSKFCMFLSRNIIYKDKTLDSLNVIKSYVLSSINQGPLDLKLLTELYLKINSCLHPKGNSEEIDVNAWNYALNRLPNNIFETLSLVLINIAPKILTTREEVHSSLIAPVKTRARMRDTFQYIDGKNVIFVRELETDVLDFVANMCIHIVESWKIRKYISSPQIMEKLFDCGEDFDKTLNVLQDTLCKINPNDIGVLKKTFGNQFNKKLLNIMLQHQDYNITINKVPQNSLDSVELWTQNLWSNAKELLGVTSSVDEIDDLVVDIVQGSKRTLIACISPHLHSHAEEIMKWGKENNIQYQTKIFNNEADRLMATSYYYYKAHPEMQKEREETEIKHGIKIIYETFGTGIGVLLVNVNKLDPKHVDPNLTWNPASKNHLILHIGYTFGAQSSGIIKPLLMLFGSKARSMNIVGKAGGLAGNRTDILVANKMFYDKTHELCTINTGEINEKELSEDTKSGVNVGPMLTVAGTILQNNDLLHFYKNVMGCIGLEMEGFFFIKEIDNAIKHALLKPEFITRCFYYASDLPLDPTQNLSMEDGNVSWDEGVGSMNAIMRFIFKKIFSG